MKIVKGNDSVRHCINVTDDNELEGDEYFMLTFNTSNSNIIIVEPDIANVTIKDNECKCLSHDNICLCDVAYHQHM